MSAMKSANSAPSSSSFFFLPAIALALPRRRAEAREDDRCDAAQRLENATAADRVRREKRHAPKIQLLVQLVDGGDFVRRQVPLVVLHDERHGARIEPVLRQILVQVLKAFDILGELARLAVRDEDHSVDSLKYQLARRRVINLSGYRIKLKPGVEPRNRAQIERQEIEEQRTVGLGRQRHHLALSLFGQLRIDLLQVRRLSRSAGTIIDDLAGDLAGAVVDDRHCDQPIRPKSESRLRFSSPSKSPAGSGFAGSTARGR